MSSEQSVEARELCYKIIALHKRIKDAGHKIARLDVKKLQTAGKKQLSGMYSSLLEHARRL